MAGSKPIRAWQCLLYMHDAANGRGTMAMITGMVDRLAARLAPRTILMYGSHARNAADANSDVDFLVLFDSLDDRSRVVADAYDALCRSPLPKDIVVATVEEFQRYRSVVNTLFYVVSCQGKVVYGAEV